MQFREEFEQGLTGFHGRHRSTLIRGAEQLLNMAGASFSVAMGKSLRQAVAAIFAKAAMTTTSMLTGHILATVERCRKAKGNWLLVAQDTTCYNYSSHKAKQGLGQLQPYLKGVLQHNVLAMDEQGTPLGLLFQHNWSRKEQGAKELGKESNKWLLGLKAVNQQLGQLQQRVLLVQDREADIFSFFKAERAANVELLVRVHQPRKLELLAQQQVMNLQQAAKAMPEQGQVQVQVNRGSKQITLTLSLSYEAVNVLPDKDKSAAKHKAQGLWLVVAKQIAATDSKGKSVHEPEKAAHWLLLSSVEVESVEQAASLVRFYSLRWRIERLHYTLKTGALQAERLQFDDVHTLINALSFYSIVAWRILYLVYQVRQEPDMAAEEGFDEKELLLLRASSKKPLKTLQQATLALAALAGFQPSAKQPLPGVKKLAEALLRLQYMKEGLELARNISLQD